MKTKNKLTIVLSQSNFLDINKCRICVGIFFHYFKDTSESPSVLGKLNTFLH